MKVVETRDAFLSDYEVLQFLSKLERQHHWNEEPTTDPNSKKKAKKHGTYNHPELEFITKNAITYLGIDKNSMPQEEDDEDDEASGQQDQPPKDARSPLSRLNDDRFCELVRRLNAFELFKAEKLQLVNQLPTNMVHLYSIVEECDSRFTEDQVADVLAIIKNYI